MMFAITSTVREKESLRSTNLVDHETDGAESFARSSRMAEHVVSE
jgi:hypothetical protein